MPELGKIERRKVVALSGLAPFARESGNLKGKRMIKGGRKRVRQALYMAVLAGIIWNKKIRGYYERLVEEKKKAKKVALTACMRKLLLIMHQMLKNGVSWQENYDGKNLVAAS
jgi:transposase